MWLGPSANKIPGDSKMALASTWVQMIEQAPQNGYHQCPSPQDEFLLPLVSLGGSPRSACRSDPGSFQIISSFLGPQSCVTFCVSFKRGIFRVLWLPWKEAPLDFIKVFWRFIFLMQNPRLESSVYWLDPLILGCNLSNCNYFPNCGLPTEGMGSWLYLSLLFLLHCGSLHF